jgi:hypothetical protein
MLKLINCTLVCWVHCYEWDEVVDMIVTNMDQFTDFLYNMEAVDDDYITTWNDLTEIEKFQSFFHQFGIYVEGITNDLSPPQMTLLRINTLVLSQTNITKSEIVTAHLHEIRDLLKDIIQLARMN